MDFIINHTNEERLSSTYINNTLEQNNETTNQEGELNILDNFFLLNKKDNNLLKIIDKQNKVNNIEEKEHKAFINNNKDIFTFDEKLNEKIQNSSKINEPKKEKMIPI